MSLILIAFSVFATHYVVGCVVLATIDYKDQRLYRWAKSAPCEILFGVVVMAWPFILWLYFKERS